MMAKAGAATISALYHVASRAPPKAVTRVPRCPVTRAAYTTASVNPFKLDQFRKRAEAAISDGGLPEEAGDQELAFHRDRARSQTPDRGSRRHPRPHEASMTHQPSPGLGANKATGSPQHQTSADRVHAAVSRSSRRRETSSATAVGAEASKALAEYAQDFHSDASDNASSRVWYRKGDHARVAQADAQGMTTSLPGRPDSFRQYSRAWIKDHCQCPKCIQPSTSQKLFRTGDAAVANRSSSSIRIKFDQQDKALRIDNVHPEQDHAYIVPVALLVRSSLDSNDIFQPTLWMGDDVAQTAGLRIPWPEVATDTGLYAATVQLMRYGLVVITDVPTDKTSDQECALRDVAGRFGEIRNVFYGQTWDVKSVANSKNIAYTDVNLGLHMDLW